MPIKGEILAMQWSLRHIKDTTLDNILKNCICLIGFTTNENEVKNKDKLVSFSRLYALSNYIHSQELYT